MAPRRYTLLIADRSSGVVRRFTLSLRPALAVAVTALALPILIGLGARWSALAEVSDLRQTSVALVMENESYRAATGQLAAQVSSLQAAVNEIGDRAALDPAIQKSMDRLPAIVRSSAIGGGGAAAATSLVSATLSSPDSTVRSVFDSVAEA